MSRQLRSRLGRILATCAGALLFAGPLMAQQSLSWPQREQAERLSGIADAVADGALAGGDAWVKWDHHFLRGMAGRVYVPFSVFIDEAPGAFSSLGLYVRVANHGEDSSAGLERMRRERYVGFEHGQVPVNVPERDFAPRGSPVAGENSAMLRLAHPENVDEATYPFEDVHFVNFGDSIAGRTPVVRRALTVAPGDYDVYVAILETTPQGEGIPRAKSAVMKRRLVVPPFAHSDLQLSSLIVAEAVDTLAAPLSPQEQLLRPYALGAAEIVPARDTIFQPSENLSLVFFVYNLLTDAADKPNATIQYRFFRHSAGRTEFFQATAPQEFNAGTLPDTFALEAFGHQLPASQAVPLARFPEGAYDLDIRVTDNLAERTVTRRLSFVVMDPAVPEP